MFAASLAAQVSRLSVTIHKEKAVKNSVIRIRFDQMVEDSRCPIGTECIWAGNAKVKITLKKGRRSQTFELNSGVSPTVVKYAGYDIKLADLTPKPAANVRINPEKYVATFEVTKNPGR
jgi:hypothetical protein